MLLTVSCGMCTDAIRGGGHGAREFVFLLFKKNDFFSPLSLPFLKRERDITHRASEDDPKPKKILTDGNRCSRSANSAAPSAELSTPSSTPSSPRCAPRRMRRGRATRLSSSPFVHHSGIPLPLRTREEESCVRIIK